MSKKDLLIGEKDMNENLNENFQSSLNYLNLNQL